MTRLIPAISSSQPAVDKKFIIYSSKKLPTVRVTLKGDKAKRELVINESDFDADRHLMVT